EVVELGDRLARDPLGGGRGHDADLGFRACKRLLNVEPRLDERRGIEHAPHLLAAEEAAEDAAVERRDRGAHRGFLLPMSRSTFVTESGSSTSRRKPSAASSRPTTSIQSSGGGVSPSCSSATAKSPRV